MLSNKEVWLLVWKVFVWVVCGLCAVLAIRCWCYRIMWPFRAEQPTVEEALDFGAVVGLLWGLWEGNNAIRKRRAEDAESGAPSSTTSGSLTGDVDDDDDPFGDE